MKQPRKQPETGGKPQVHGFGPTLRGAIKSEFGTNRALAAAIGRTESWISHIISGREETSPATLNDLLEAFSTRSLQEKVHAAWVAEFAPLPKRRARDYAPEELLSQIHILGLDGLPTRALGLAREWRTEVDDPEAWQLLTRQIIEISLRLTKVSGAVAALTEMEKRAIARNDKENLLTALWMRGLALRNLDNISVEVLNGAHNDAVTFSEAHKPDRGKSLEEWQTNRAILDRDFALHLLTFHERKPLPQEALEKALQLVERSIERGPADAFEPYGLEVRARIESAMGQVFRAEETLAELEDANLPEGSEIWEKAELTRAKVLAARGESDEAEAVLEGIADACFERMNLHHHRVADQLLARLRAGLVIS